MVRTLVVSVALAVGVLMGLLVLFSASPSHESAAAPLRSKRTARSNPYERGLQSDTYECGCPSCTADIWSTVAPAGATGEAFTCGARISALTSTMEAADACRLVGTEFMDECGACHPDVCSTAVVGASLESEYFADGDVTSPNSTVLTGFSAPLPDASYVGNNGNFAGAGLLGKCQADCDSDADCQSGLICYQRNPGTPVPGCNGFDNWGYDYCIEPQPGVVPTPAPVYTPAPVAYSNQGGAVPGTSSSSSDAPGSNDDQPNIDDHLNEGYVSSFGFALKMYWEQGYDWQGEHFERKWCMRCDDNDAECASGRGVFIVDCDDHMTTTWEYLVLPDGSFHLRIRDTDLCLQANGYSRVTVERCSNIPNQLWNAVDGSLAKGGRFELRAKPFPNDCVTQQHHPKANEFLYLYPCYLPETDHTNFWNFYDYS